MDNDPEPPPPFDLEEQNSRVVELSSERLEEAIRWLAGAVRSQKATSSALSARIDGLASLNSDDGASPSLRGVEDRLTELEDRVGALAAKLGEPRPATPVVEDVGGEESSEKPLWSGLEQQAAEGGSSPSSTLRRVGVSPESDMLIEVRREIISVQRVVQKLVQRAHHVEKLQAQRDAAQDHSRQMIIDNLGREIGTCVKAVDLDKQKDLLMTKMSTMDLELQDKIRGLHDQVLDRLTEEFRRTQEQVDKVNSAVSEQLKSMDDRMNDNMKKQAEFETEINSEFARLAHELERLTGVSVTKSASPVAAREGFPSENAMSLAAQVEGAPVVKKLCEDVDHLRQRVDSDEMQIQALSSAALENEGQAGAVAVASLDAAMGNASASAAGGEPSAAILQSLKALDARVKTLEKRARELVTPSALTAAPGVQEGSGPSDGSGPDQQATIIAAIQRLQAEMEDLREGLLAVQQGGSPGHELGRGAVLGGQQSSSDDATAQGGVAEAGQDSGKEDPLAWVQKRVDALVEKEHPRADSKPKSSVLPPLAARVDAGSPTKHPTESHSNAPLEPRVGSLEQRMEMLTSSLEERHAALEEQQNGAVGGIEALGVRLSALEDCLRPGEGNGAQGLAKGKDNLAWLQRRVDRIIEKEDEAVAEKGRNKSLEPLAKKAGGGLDGTCGSDLTELPVAPTKSHGVSLAERVEEMSQRLEDVAKQSAKAAKFSGNGMNFLEEFRRLRTRFEYIERVVPPDVQRALQFFKRRDESTSEFDGVLHEDPKLDAELGAQLDNMRQDLTVSGEEFRREVQNVLMAVRNVQRDSSLNGSKIEDLTGRHNALRSRIEVALPQILEALEQLIKAPGAGDVPGTPKQAETGDGQADTGSKNNPLAELESLFKDVDHRLGTAPHPFVSQDALRRQLSVLHKEVQGWLAQLREEVTAALRAKVGSEQLKEITVRIDHTQQELSRTCASIVPDVTAQHSCLTRTRCMTCNTLVDQQSPAHPMVTEGGITSTTAVTGTHARWPNRQPILDRKTQENFATAGRSGIRTMKKDLSLPRLSN